MVKFKENKNHNQYNNKQMILLKLLVIILIQLY